jgi:hypothetical protein
MVRPPIVLDKDADQIYQVDVFFQLFNFFPEVIGFLTDNDKVRLVQHLRHQTPATPSGM